MTFIEELLSETKEGRLELSRQELIVSVTEQIWAALQAANMSKADLARALETSKANVTQLLNGQRNMKLATLADICSAINVKPSIMLFTASGARVVKPVHKELIGDVNTAMTGVRPTVVYRERTVPKGVATQAQVFSVLPQVSAFQVSYQ
jgi:transcriptional regulator with XRE-family HTH domain